MRKQLMILGFFGIWGLMNCLAYGVMADDDTVIKEEKGGATITRDADGATISGIATSVGVVDTQRVQGSVEGSLRINWNSRDRDRDRGNISPPGAPELPANTMFGSGLVFLGLGLLLYRKLW